MANYTILLIDYDPRSIERTRGPLVAAGYTVHVATDGLSGVASFAELQPDLVLIEAMIPKKHGFEVCQDLKKTPQGKRTPFVIMTSVYKGRKYRSQALHLYQCDEYVEKPIADDQLLGVVRRFIGEAPVPAPGTRPPAPVPTRSAVEDEVDFVTALSDEDGSGIEIEIVDTDADAEVEAAEPEPPRPAPMPTGPRKVVIASDDAEIEIMERLDAIIPGASGTTSSPKASFGGAATAAARRLDEPAPGDFVVAPADEIAVAETIPAPAEIRGRSGRSQIVSFDRAKRARKGKRGRGVSAAAPGALPPSPTPEPTENHAAIERPVDHPIANTPASPSASTVFSARNEAPGDRPDTRSMTPGSPADWSQAMPPSYETEAPAAAMPSWVWVVAAVGILVAVYVLVLR